MLKDWAKFSGFAAILAVALTFSILWALDYIPQNSEWTCKTENGTNQQNSRTEYSIVCHLTQAENLPKQTDATDRNSTNDFFEGVKITDVFLALFTGLLVIVGGFQAYWLWGTVEATGDVASASLRQAAATIALEAPIITVQQIKLVGYPDAVNPQSNVDPATAQIPDVCRALIGLMSAGRTHAHMTVFCLEWTIAPILPANPQYIHIEAINALFPPNLAFTNFLGLGSPVNPIILTAEQRVRLAQGETFWVYGFVTYKSFANEIFELGYIARWVAGQGMISDGNPAYQYSRKR